MPDPAAREGSILGQDGTWLHWRAWPASDPHGAVAIVHGLGEHGGRYGTVGRWLQARGWSCWAIDLRGMGRSGGARGRLDRWEEWLDDVRRFVGLIEDQSPAGIEIVPLGHSVGGVVVSSAVIRGVLHPRRFVLSNPAFRVRLPVPVWKRALSGVLLCIAPRLTVANGIDPSLLARDPAVGAAYVADRATHDRVSAGLYRAWMDAAREVLTRAGELRTPFLLLLSQEDPIVDPAASDAFDHAAHAGQTVRRYAGRLHEPLNDFDAEEVLTDILTWLERERRVAVEAPAD
ncbi:MAG: alpha/beta fold hydrolase [Candidatus Dormiibacterota bacterium]